MASVIENAAASISPNSSAPASAVSAGFESGPSSGSASEALIKAATAASSPATPAEGAQPAPTPTVASPGQTGTTQPAIVAQPEVNAAQTGASGEAPEARITAATRNARAKTIQEYGGYQPTEVRSAMELVQSIQRDPVGFITQIIKDVQAKGFQLPGMGTAPTVEAPTGFPDSDIETVDGKIQGWSRDSNIRALQQLKREILQELSPDLGFIHSERERAAAESAKAESRSQAAEIKGRVESLPHYKENEVAIATKLRTMRDEQPDIIRRFGVPAALYHCYSEVVAEVAHKSSEAKVRDDFARKAATSIGSAHPVSTGGDAKTPELKTQADLARHMERMAASMSGSA